jgi:hypothetical protein
MSLLACTEGGLYPYFASGLFNRAGQVAAFAEQGRLLLLHSKTACMRHA